MCVHAFNTPEHVWKPEDNLQKSVLSSYRVGPWIQFRSSGLLAGGFTHWVTSLAHFKAWNTSLNWILKIIHFSAAISDVSVVIWRYFPSGLCVLCLFNNYSTDTSKVLTVHHVLFIKQNDKTRFSLSGLIRIHSPLTIFKYLLVRMLLGFDISSS